MVRLSAPKGSHYSITAGKRSAPAGGVRTQDGPQGGPTAVRWCGRARIGRLGRLVRGVVRPLWGRECEGGVCGPRVRHAHPRLQISSALIGPHASLRFVAGRTAEPHISLRFGVCCTAGPHASLRFGVCRTAELHDFLRFGAGCPAAELMMRLSAPQGSHYSIAAGKRSAPAGGVRLQDGPQGGPTAVRWCGRARIGRLGRLVRGVVRPLWGRECEGVVWGPRVRFAHPRLQISSAHIGPHASLRFSGGRTAGPHISLRFVVGRIAGPHASLRFGVCRTAELHDFLRFGAGCPAAELMMRQSAPQGSHYSIAAGKRSAPAGGVRLQDGPQGGPTAVRWCGRARIGRLGRLVRGVVRPLWGRECEGGVCGPRVRHAHPRLQISSALIGPHASLRFAAGRTVGPHASLRFVAGCTAGPHVSPRFAVGCPAA